MRVFLLATLGPILWWAGDGLHAVQAEDATRPPASPYLVSHWTTENGLPQNSVTALAQTPDGYLWVGTFGGLARFDGMNFTIFNSGNTPALHSNRISSLHLGRSGKFWIGTEDGAVVTYQQGEFRLFKQLQQDTRGTKVARTIYENQRGDVWVGMDDVGLWRFAGGDAARGEYFDERHGLTSSLVQNIQEDGAGRLWVCANLGLSLLNPARIGQADMFETRWRGSAKDWLLKILPHPAGGLWLLTETHLGQFDGSTFSGRLSERPLAVTGLADAAHRRIIVQRENRSAFSPDAQRRRRSSPSPVKSVRLRPGELPA
jgi:hypothetical protein